MKSVDSTENWSRRALLARGACGFGSLALAGLCGASGATGTVGRSRLHHLPRARRVIFLFMHGGPSHVDSFDWKPTLQRDDGKELPVTGYRFDDLGKDTRRTLMASPWEFRAHGQSGRMVSSLFPRIAEQVDKLCFIHSMHTEGVAHGPATLFLHTGQVNLVRPSMGSWISYGLGTENANLPAFVTLQPPRQMGGPRNYGSGFLPAMHQGTSVGDAGSSAAESRFRHLDNGELTQEDRRRRFALLQDLNRVQSREAGGGDALEAAARSFELAWRMQRYAPEVMDLSREPESLRRLYGLDRKETAEFGRQCLLARRLSEAGVRFVQVNYSDNTNNPRWDQHNRIRDHEKHAAATDQPAAALLADLESRGLLEDTLVWWGGEFGRTPFSQNGDGRDHNPPGFTVWLAGGGIRPGHAHGATDAYGFRAEQDKVHMHDLHATLLHLLGLDHERLIYRHAGRDFRLTDVYGRVVHEVMTG